MLDKRRIFDVQYVKCSRGGHIILWKCQECPCYVEIKRRKVYCNLDKLNE